MNTDTIISIIKEKGTISAADLKGTGISRTSFAGLLAAFIRLQTTTLHWNLLLKL
jgi:hypothetical protein